jgi:hypothetical protein
MKRRQLLPIDHPELSPGLASLGQDEKATPASGRMCPATSLADLDGVGRSGLAVCEGVIGPET